MDVTDQETTIRRYQQKCFREYALCVLVPEALVAATLAPADQQQDDKNHHNSTDEAKQPGAHVCFSLTKALPSPGSLDTRFSRSPAYSVTGVISGNWLPNSARKRELS